MSGTRGVVWIHSAPAALRPHLEWAMGAVFGAPIELAWSDQPAEPRTLRAEYPWHGAVGTGAELASALHRLSVDFGVERSPERRFALWVLLDSLGEAPAPADAFDDPAHREAANRYLDAVWKAERDATQE